MGSTVSARRRVGSASLSRVGSTAGAVATGAAQLASATRSEPEMLVASYTLDLKGLSYEIDFENVDKNRQILALIRAAADF
jgi:hypothetical protein